MLTPDRAHVVDILPHLWVLDGRLITGKREINSTIITGDCVS